MVAYELHEAAAIGNEGKLTKIVVVVLSDVLGAVAANRTVPV